MIDQKTKSQSSPSEDVILQTNALCKGFGGVRACDDVGLSLKRNEVHALIGPNGAGKTTLLAILSGLLKPDSGLIMLNGEDITGKPSHALAVRGLARSFQITSVFDQLSVHDNVALAVQARSGHSFRFWGIARSDQRLRKPALEYLAAVGLQERCEESASALSHGERRQLEIAMALATEPQLLLLDEPMAGMGPEESREMAAVLQQLRGKRTLLLVEHDMETVFSLADRISVLVYGKIIATGSADEIRANSDVQQAYLGDDEQLAEASVQTHRPSDDADGIATDA